MDGTREQLDHAVCRRLGIEVRRLRNARGWSLAELSVKAHYSVGYLSKIENGKKRVTTEMARAFDDAFGTDGALTGLLATPEEPTPIHDEPERVDVGPCPYPGLAAFSAEEARWFFGRAQVTSDLLRRLDERLGGDGPLAVVAPSGAGKSSLLAAGLIPALARGALPGSGEWLVVTATPSARPLATLATRVAERTGADPATAAAVAGDPDRFAAFLTEAVTRGKPGETPSSARVVLILDQFEEIFTECRHEGERRAFIAALGAAAGLGVLVVLGIRADFYGQCLAYPVLLSALQAPVALGPMSAEQLRAIIACPAAAEGLEVEPGLVELLLLDLGMTGDTAAETAGYDPGALPLLAHALRVTWQQRQNRTLTVAGYRSSGGIRQALASTAERAYTRLAPTEQQIARQVLLRLVNVRDQGEDTRRRLTRTQLIQALSVQANTVENVLEVLGRARLVTFTAENMEITHEALLSAWPRLAGWLSADRGGLRTHQQLSEAAEAWQAAGRDPSRLYRGTQLALTHDWATDPTRHDRLSAHDDAFLKASLDQQHRERQAHRRRIRRVRQLIAALTVLVVIATAGFVLRDLTARQRDQAFSGMVATRASQLSMNDPTRGMQLSAAAYGIADNPETRSSLLSASTLHSATRVLADSASINTVAISGHILACGSSDQTIRFYDISNPTAPVFLSSITGHTDSVNVLAFSPNGRTLASGGSDRTVRLWDTSDPRHPHLLASRYLNIAHRKGVNAVAFNPAGSTLAIGDADGAVRLWDLDSNHDTNVLPGRAPWVNAVAFSPTDGQTLISGNDDGTMYRWDFHHPYNQPKVFRDLANPTDLIETVAVSPDGRTLASGTLNGIVQMWDLTDANNNTPFFTTPPGRTGSGANKAVAFSPDRHTLAIGNADGKVWLADLTNLHQAAPADLPLTAVPLGDDIGSVNTVAFSADGRTLATGSSTASNNSTGVVAMADIPDSHHPTPLTPLWHKVINSVYTVAFSPDGHTLASGIDAVSDNGESATMGMVFLWDIDHPGTSQATLPSGSGSVYAVAFDPSDGHIVASGGSDGTVRLWDRARPNNPIATLPGGAGRVYAVAFSPDGRTLASGDADGTLRLWDLTHPTQPQSLDILRGNTSWVNAVAFSPHGHLLASGGVDGNIRLWDVSNPHHIVPLPVLAKDDNYNTYSHAVTFSPDETMLVSGNNDGSLLLWDLTDPHHPVRAATPRLSADDQMVRSVAFNPDGHLLATGSDDDTVKLWDFTDHSHPTLWAVLTGHGDSVRGVAFNPVDGHTLASGSQDSQIRLWDTNPDNARNDICVLTTTTRINDQQWKQYFPNMPHQPSCQ
ncbi:MAG: helix-turn-helix domain-containing protein [Pseudonocardiaceae bacterium]